MQQSAPIPLLTFSPNPNHYYTSTNDTLTMAVSNVQIGIVLSLQIISLLLIGNLLIFVPLFGHIPVKISAIIKLYLSLHALLLAFGLPTYVQKAFGLFDPRTNLYLVVCIYDIAGPYNFIQPYLSLILTLERILIIRFPITFMRYRKHYICGAAILTPLVYILTIFWYFLEMPLDPAIALKSPPLINTSPKFNYIPHTALKLTFGGLDIFCSAFFFMYLKKEMGKNIKNRVVKFTVICEILLEVLPAFILQIVNLTKIMPDILKLFAANFSTVMATLNLTLCVLYYNWIFMLVAPRQQIGAVSTTGQVKIIAVRSTKAMK